MNPMTDRIVRLLALNRDTQREYKIVSVAASNEATLYLYDIIGYDFWSGGGITAKQFAKDLVALGNKTLHLRVNSPGGDVFEGRAMVAALQSYPGKVIAHIDGLAASAASFLVMHADEIEMTDGSFMMIHNGWTCVCGDRHDMASTIGLLEKIDASIADDYHKKSGLSVKKLSEWMDAETWFTAAEAVKHGLANRIAADQKDTKAKAQAWNMAAYDKPPAALLNDDSEHAGRLRKLDLVDRDRMPIAQMHSSHADRLRKLDLALSSR